MGRNPNDNRGQGGHGRYNRFDRSDQGGRGQQQGYRGRSKSCPKYEDKKKSTPREVKFQLPSNDPKVYVPTYATVTDAIVQQVQKNYKYGQDMATAIDSIELS